MASRMPSDLGAYSPPSIVEKVSAPVAAVRRSAPEFVQLADLAAMGALAFEHAGYMSETTAEPSLRGVNAMRALYSRGEP